jgi:hypothetical protein
MLMVFLFIRYLMHDTLTGVTKVVNGPDLCVNGKPTALPGIKLRDVVCW